LVLLDDFFYSEDNVTCGVFVKEHDVCVSFI
jgi:hypothetical protein